MPIKQIISPESVDENVLAEIVNKPRGTFGKHVDPTYGWVLAYLSTDTEAFDEAWSAYPAVALQQAKTRKLEELAVDRRTHELKGPMNITLDDKTQLRMLGAGRMLENNPDILSIDWEVSRGVFAEISRDTILQIENIGMLHIHNCFRHAKNKTSEIMAVTLEEGIPPYQAYINALEALEDIDIKTGWPVAGQ